MTHSITNTIAGIATALLCIFLAGIVGLFTMVSLASLNVQSSTQFEQMRTNGTVYDTALCTTDGTGTP